MSRWQRWLFPALCILPYLTILIWLLSRGLVWVSQVLLSPSLDGSDTGDFDPWARESRVQSPPA